MFDGVVDDLSVDVVAAAIAVSRIFEADWISFLLGSCSNLWHTALSVSVASVRNVSARHDTIAI